MTTDFISKLETDPHSFSRPDKVSLRHIDLELEVDFRAKEITGRASLHLNPSKEDELVLDTRNLDIKRVTAGRTETDVEYALGDNVHHLGQPLTIRLPAKANLIHIYYLAGGDRGALQWLEPSYTTGGRYPFLFTQSQTIGARTWIPCQDTPRVRTTYNARVKVPKGLMALMSAENPTEQTTSGVYQFKCYFPIPSYLFALAVGELDHFPLGPRSGVYAERAVVSHAAWEFGEIESMIRAAEQLYGPYRWNRFDLVVLPPSFPLGGMENPQLIFITPTVLAGDRSLTSLVAHELAHAWSGNLVTNATWNDFWLNEGFSVYAEHRIVEELHGKDYDEMLVSVSLRRLKQALADLPPRDTWLHGNLDSRHPDDCFTEIPYDKGYLFLRMLEESFGRERWDRFVRKYVDSFAFRSVTSSVFVAFLREHLVGTDKKLEESVRISDWLYGPGLPQNCPSIYSTELERVVVQIQRIQRDDPARNICTGGWTTHHWVYFLGNLEVPASATKLEELDETFRLSETGNADILYSWLLLCIASQYGGADFALKNFLHSQGRLRYVKGLYQALVKSSEGKKKAEQIYSSARAKYHSSVVRVVDQILG